MVIFSAHYDHIGKGMNGSEEVIYNGANIMLPVWQLYYHLQDIMPAVGNNERTLVLFVCS